MDNLGEKVGLLPVGINAVGGKSLGQPSSHKVQCPDPLGRRRRWRIFMVEGTDEGLPDSLLFGIQSPSPSVSTTLATTRFTDDASEEEQMPFLPTVLKEKSK